jgi:DNA-binding response OmpR family regulator
MPGTTSTLHPKTSEPKKVVVVEDDPSVAVLIAAILADEGFAPFVVRDGRKALQAVRELQPDVVTLDLHLPGLDGHAVLRRLVSVDIEHRPSVVVVSASTDELSRDERRMIARTLTKPFDLCDLVEAVEDVVGKQAL